MYNSLNRLQNVFGYFTTVAAAVAMAIAAISLVSTPVPEIGRDALQLRNVQVIRGRPNYHSTKKEEVAHIKFDLDIDLSPVFTWNTKQIFLYITATYPPSSSKTTPSQSVIWDAVLRHPLASKHHNVYNYPGTKRSSSKSKSKSKKDEPPHKPGILKLDSQRPKYQIADPTGRVAGRTNATLEINWNIQPWVGALQWVNAPRRGPITDASSRGFMSWLPTWRVIKHNAGRTPSFDLPAVKERSEAAKSAGKQGLDLERGTEGNRGRPS